MFRKKKNRSGVRYGKPDVRDYAPLGSSFQTSFSQGFLFRKIPDRVGISFDARKLKLTNRNIGKYFSDDIVEVNEENIETIHPRIITKLIERDISRLNPDEYAVEEVRMPDDKHGHKVKWYLVRFIDPVYNEVTFRIKSWTDFVVIVYVNGYRILVRYCDENKIPYKTLEEKPNAFEEIGLTPQVSMMIIKDALSQENMVPLFERHIHRILPSISEFYKPKYTFGKINQLEFAYDVKYPNNATAVNVFWKWVTEHRTMFPKGQIYWDDEVISFDVQQEPGDKPQFKLYVFRNMLRFEYTYNTKHLTECGIDRTDIDEMYREGDKDFIDLAEKTTPIKVKDASSPRKRVHEFKKMVMSESDIGFLWALNRLAWGKIKNEDVRLKSGECIDNPLSRGQVQYRLREKFPMLVEKVNKRDGKTSRTWKVKNGVRWLITHVIESLEVFSMLYDKVIYGRDNQVLSLELPQILSSKRRVVQTSVLAFPT